FAVYLYSTLRYRPEAYEHNRTTHSSSPPTPTPIHHSYQIPILPITSEISRSLRKHRTMGRELPTAYERQATQKTVKVTAPTFDCHPGE
ncbi:hypothetical protein CDAR_47271, partial [Caerostris darwini]